MSRSKKIALSLVTLLILVWWFWPSSYGQGENELTAADMGPMVNRVWINHIPKTERDKIDVFVMIDDPSFGAFSHTSAFEGDWSSFEWSTDKKLHIRMLQSGKKHHISATIIKGPGCEPFDYCMRIKGTPRGAKKYVSMEEWVIEPAMDARDLVPTALVDQIFFSGNSDSE